MYTNRKAANPEPVSSKLCPLDPAIAAGVESLSCGQADAQSPDFLFNWSGRAQLIWRRRFRGRVATRRLKAASRCLGSVGKRSSSKRGRSPGTARTRAVRSWFAFAPHSRSSLLASYFVVPCCADMNLHVLGFFLPDVMDDAMHLEAKRRFWEPMKLDPMRFGFGDDGHRDRWEFLVAMTVSERNQRETGC